MNAVLPELAVNQSFMAAFLAAEPPCLALGLVEAEGARCALVVLRPRQAVPRHITAAGFRFGHALLGGAGWEVVHFAFAFNGFAGYNALLNPSDPVARSVLTTMATISSSLSTQIAARRPSAPTWAWPALPGFAPT